MQRTGPDPETFEVSFRRLILVRVSLFLGALTIAGTALRHIVSPMPWRILITNTVIAAMFSLTPLLRHRKPGLMIWTFLAGFAVLIANGGLLAGGINAPICVLLPLIPVMGFCFGGLRTGQAALALSLTLTAGLVIAERAGWCDPVMDPANVSIQRASNLIVILSASFAIGYIYETFRKRAEQRLVEYSRLASLGTMAGGIAHEINNPLAIVMGYAEQIELMARSRKADPDRMVIITEKIRNTCNRIAKVVSALRNYARDEITEPAKNMSLAGATNDALDFCRERFIKAGIEVQAPDLQLHGHIAITARHNLVLEVILEILNNAYSAVTDGSEKDSPKWIKVEIDETSSHVILRISNSGPVIPERIRSKIFVPFFTTREVGKGTGIGLSLCAANMHRTGGEIFLDPHADVTTFIMRFAKQAAGLSPRPDLAAS